MPTEIEFRGSWINKEKVSLITGRGINQKGFILSDRDRAMFRVDETVVVISELERGPDSHYVSIRDTSTTIGRPQWSMEIGARWDLRPDEEPIEVKSRGEIVALIKRLPQTK